MLARSSQRKCRPWLVFGLALAFSTLPAPSALAAGGHAATSSSSAGTDASATPSTPAPPVSPFTGQQAGAPAAAAPLPPPVPPDTPPASSGESPLPPPPAPRAPVPPATATPFEPSAPVLAPARPGAVGSDLPAPPRAARGVHLHDSFYLRLGLGLAVSGALVSSDSKSINDYRFSGGGGAADLWIGGTPTPGLAMGAALSFLGLNSGSRRVDGHKVSGDVSGNTGMVGFFVDGFPDPERGFHFGGALGIASGTADTKDNDIKRFDGGGLGLEGFVGYDFWISPQWSLGAMARFMGSITREDSEGVNYETSIGGASLSFTALYH